MKNKKTIVTLSLLLAILLSLVISAAVLGESPAPSETPDTPSDAEQAYIVKASDYSGISEKALKSMYERAGQILESYDSISVSGVLDKGDTFFNIRESQKAGIGFAATGYLGCYTLTTRPELVTETRDGDWLVSLKAFRDGELNEHLQYLIMLAILEQNPDCYAYKYEIYYDDVEAYERLNWRHHTLIVCDTWQELGYESLMEYRLAVLNGEEKNVGDIFIVSLDSPRITVIGSNDNLLELWAAKA